MSKSLAEALPELMSKVRDEVLPHYLAIGPAGAIGAAMIRHDLDTATKAIMSGDVIQMLRSYETLKEIKT